jgi:hypothetical protein
MKGVGIMNCKLKKIMASLLVVFLIFSIAPLDVFAASETYINIEVDGREEFYNPDDMPDYGGFALFGSRAGFSGSFGAQLSGEASLFYDALVRNYAEEKNAGKYTYTFSEPIVIYDLKYKKSTGELIDNADGELELYHAYICSVVFDSADAFLRDMPDIFWFRNSSFDYSYSVSISNSYKDIVNATVTISKVDLKPVEIYKNAASDMAAFDSAVAELVDEFEEYFKAQGSSITREDKLRYVHDYICNNSDYDYESLEIDNDYAAHSAMPFFIGDKLHVCEGYAKTFKIICDELGIPCVCVSGYVKDSDYPNDPNKEEGHMWNYVQMEDGKWYIVDITWDDQTGRIYDTYFLANWNSEGFFPSVFPTLKQERYEKYTFSNYNGSAGKSFVYPQVSSEVYKSHTHSWGEYTVTKAATCCETGEKVAICTVGSCASVNTVIIDIDENLHSYTEKITTQPTHFTQGVKTFTCYCGHSYTVPVAKLEAHVYDAVVTAPKCNAEGYTTYICKCGYSYVSDYVSKLPHSYTSEVKLEPTHLKEGVEQFTCDCGDSYTKAIEKLETHTYTAISERKPTCTEDGYITYSCQCGNTYTDSNAKSKGHSFGAWYETKAATCSIKGEKRRDCSDCEDFEAEQTETLPHDYSIVSSVAPTCTADGKIVYSCACSYSYTEIVSATGHSFNGSVCTDCSYDQSEDCSCNCHKSGFSGLIWKILVFFYRIFGAKKTCACGISHY